MAQLIKNPSAVQETWARSPREGKGYPLQYSGLENSVNFKVQGVTKSQIQLSDFHFHFQIYCINQVFFYYYLFILVLTCSFSY